MPNYRIVRDSGLIWMKRLRRNTHTSPSIARTLCSRMAGSRTINISITVVFFLRFLIGKLKRRSCNHEESVCFSARSFPGYWLGSTAKIEGARARLRPGRLVPARRGAAQISRRHPLRRRAGHDAGRLEVRSRLRGHNRFEGRGLRLSPREEGRPTRRL